MVRSNGIGYELYKPCGCLLLLRYLPEAAHPYEIFKAAGMEMEWASPKGGVAPLDESSIAASQADAASVSFAGDEDKKALWSSTKSLADCDASDYSAIFYVGG